MNWWFRTISLILLVNFSACSHLKYGQITPHRGQRLPSISTTTREEDEWMEEIDIGDPLEGFNRQIFAYNIYLLQHVAKPVVEFYHTYTNKAIRNMVNNLGNRMRDPMIFLNSLLQLDWGNSLKTLITFSTNMTIGCFGLWDPAKNLLGLVRENRTLGQTLALWGVNEGFFLMVPLLGPYTFRDGFGLAASFYMDPIAHNGFSLLRQGSWTNDFLLLPKYFVMYVDKANGAITLNDNFVQKSFDPYVFLKYSYRSNLRMIEKKLKWKNR
jgi:phospholipid-binding lipoprotein MlaA